MQDGAMFYKQFAKKPQITNNKYTNTQITNHQLLHYAIITSKKATYEKSFYINWNNDLNVN